MIIGIDGNEANVQTRVGVSEVGFQLLKQFREMKRSGTKFIIYLKSEPLEDMPKEAENWKYRVLKPGRLWTQWRLPLDLYLQKAQPDVFFSPAHYAPRFCPMPSVIAIMDLSYLYFPELFKARDLFQLKNWTAYSVKKAKKVLTISESSKFDIIKEYKVETDKVEVIYPGIKTIKRVQNSMNLSNKIQAKYGIGRNFILFVGTLQPRKNIVRLIEAFKKLKTPASTLHSGGQAAGRQNSKLKNDEINCNDLELVIIGKKGWLYEEILRRPEELGIKDDVKFLHEVEDEELAWFYGQALVYVLPSLYEGFGLPVLEAMQYGCPVITSKVSSLPEAGGDAAVYVNPLDSDDIADKILKVINDPKLRKDLSEKGRKQLQKFSWEKAAKETLNVLEGIGNKK